MAFLEQQLDALAAADRWSYGQSQESAAEPAAWAALALAAHGRQAAAAQPAAWLAAVQQRNGAVGVTASLLDPCWPTGLALLAWCTLLSEDPSLPFARHVDAAVPWSLAARGRTAPRSVHVGHDTELTGWSWAADTHSWLEPTCMFVLGLAAAGHCAHPRVREGVALIVDRLLPAGGANYGNTIVLGQPLVPHVQPTGLALLALAGERVADERIGRSLDYLQREIRGGLAPSSLALGCMALAAHGRRPDRADEWIEQGLGGSRNIATSDHERALLVLAAASPSRWLPARATTIETTSRGSLP